MNKVLTVQHWSLKKKNQISQVFLEQKKSVPFLIQILMQIETESD